MRKLVIPVFLVLLATGITASHIGLVFAPPVCSNPSCVPITVTLDANGIGSSTNNRDITPDPFKGTALTPGATGDIRDLKLKYDDTNSNNQWDSGEPVVYDADNSGTYTAGDIIVAGTPVINDPLKGDFRIRFQDDNDNNLWDTGEAVFRDANNNFVFDSGDTVIVGTPSTGGSLATQSKSFRVGAIINATASAPATGVYGWQFSITYNKTLMMPQGDPWPANPAYPDGANSTVQYGTGTPNWAGFVSSNGGFGVFQTANVSGSNTLATALVGFTALPPTPAQTINSRQLLASVQFEVIAKPSTAQYLPIGDVEFVDASANIFSNINGGASATETITNAPPHARFTATRVSGTVFNFDGSGSTDSDGTIADPAGYFWDFGDGTQDLGTTGSLIVAHDFGPAGTPKSYAASLRVVDNLGATGAARDSLGAILPTSLFGAFFFGAPQPSHTNQTVFADKTPIASFTSAPSNPTTGATVNFDGSASTDADGSITTYAWDFGDSGSGSGATTSHAYSAKGTYHVTLTVTDDSGSTGSIPNNVIVDNPPTVTLTPPTNPVSGQSLTLTIASSDDGSIASVKIDWGDGTVETNLPGTTTSRTHTYANAGSFTITVTVTDDAGLTNTKTSTINVVAPSGPAAGLPLTTILLIAIPIIVVVAIAALLMMRRRRGEAAPQVPKT